LVLSLLENLENLEVQNHLEPLENPLMLEDLELLEHLELLQ